MGLRVESAPTHQILSAPLRLRVGLPVAVLAVLGWDVGDGLGLVNEEDLPA